MLKIKNRFQEESLSCRKAEGKNLGNRGAEIINLQEICDCCLLNHEKIECDMSRLYSMEVEPGVSFLEWLYTGDMPVDTDVHDMVMLMVQSSFCDSEDCEESENDGRGSDGQTIGIALGIWNQCAYDKRTYFQYRRRILSELKDVDEFCNFMKTCFLDSLFSDEIWKSMRQIPQFSFHTREIVNNLSLLNDEAIDIYLKHEKNGQMAMRELAAKALDCSGDPAHKGKLKFPFTFPDKAETSGVFITEEISCEPHMKLIRKDSNLRIYFWWYDERIADGKKVLIGSIGGHPYKRK